MERGDRTMNKKAQLLGIGVGVIILLIVLAFAMAMAIFKPILVLMLVMVISIPLIIWKQDLAGMSPQSAIAIFGMLFSFSLMIMSIGFVNNGLSTILGMDLVRHVPTDFGAFTGTIYSLAYADIQNGIIQTTNSLLPFFMLGLVFFIIWRIPMFGTR